MAIFAIKVLLKALIPICGSRVGQLRGLPGNDSSQILLAGSPGYRRNLLYDESDGVMNEVTKEKVAKEAAMEITAARNKMLTLLEQMQQKGVKLFVDGEAAPPGEIASKAVCEGSTYMADYVLGENGTIEQVRFDQVAGR